MLLLVLNVIYVLLAVAMIALILMQRGAGAQAGSGFGGGASATVFGSRGASNFLSKSTKWMAIVFFAISLFMAWYHTRNTGTGNVPAQQDLGVMAQQPVPAGENPKVPSAPGSTAIPSAPATAPAVVPQAPTTQDAQPQLQPQQQQPQPSAPAAQPQTPPATPQGG